MKLFLDRNKTLLPRIDVIYLLTRVMTLIGISWFVIYGDYGDENIYLFYTILCAFVAHLAIFLAAVKNKFDIKLAYLSAVLYDIIVIPLLIIHTGGINSSYFLLLYLTVSVATYVLTIWFSAAVTMSVSLVYLFSVYSDISYETLFDISIRIGMLWVYYFVLSYVSEYIRKSERRLLGLFDTLNKRTSELEKSQAELELIYENSRALASILNIDDVAQGVMNIMGNIMRYSEYAMILRDQKGNYYFRARSLNGQINYHPKSIDMTEMQLLDRVCEHGEDIIIKDMSGRDDYKPLGEKSRSLIIVPIQSHGQITGALVAESNLAGIFKEKDKQMLSIVSRSAGLALENAELHNKMEELTTIDELTGIFNYRYFVRKLQEEKRRAHRYSLPLSLIMVDIDWFKKLNDNYGHEIGNIVLKNISKIINKCIRDVDIFVRYGGEEFVVILPQTLNSEASQIGERIRDQIEKASIHVDGAGKIKTTVSVGVSSFPENGKSQEELLSIADQALYRAKDEGRNVVCVI